MIDTIDLRVINVGLPKEANSVMKSKLPAFSIIDVEAIGEVSDKLVPNSFLVLNVPSELAHSDSVRALEPRLKEFPGYFINYYSTTEVHDPDSLIRLIESQVQEFTDYAHRSALEGHYFGENPTLH